MNELESVERAIAALEAQRAVLGDEVADVALAPLLGRRNDLLDRMTAEQRKIVTVLFADVVDFTVLSQALDPEDTRSVINAYFRRWRQQIEERGGEVEKFVGDAVMAVFGLRHAREDDPHQAIRAALGMRSALAELNARIAENHQVTLEMRVGIDTGEVVVSELDERKQHDFVVVGETVNRAARIQAAAPPGGIQISRDTYRQVRGWFDFTEVAPLQLKGITDPVGAFLVESERVPGFGSDEARGVEGVETRTVGREVPLQLLRDEFLDVAEERHWRVVTVMGDAGVGKSRLLLEFDRWLAEDAGRLRRFTGRAAPQYQDVANGLLREVLATGLGIAQGDPPAILRAKLEAGLGGWFGPGEAGHEQAHLVGHWLGWDLGDSRHVARLRHDPQGLRERASTHLAEYFALLGQERTVVILLEDLHWADDASLSWLEGAEHLLRGSPVLAVATARPSLLERRADWGQRLTDSVRLLLEPLSRRESASLLGELLRRGGAIPESLRNQLLDATEGNPFHLEEVVKWLLESGVLVADHGAWRVQKQRLDTLEVPATLRGVLQARIDALTPPEHVALQQASVVGRVFWGEAVATLNTDAGGGGDTSAALDGLRGREVVQQRPQSAFPNTTEFQFKHAVLRDVAYDSLLRAQRKLYHALVAQWLEQRTELRERADEHAALIAGHYDKSGRAEEAGRWYLRAARQASSVHALAEVTRLLDRAIEIVAQPELRFDLLLTRERATDQLGDRKGQRGDLDALNGLAPRLDDRRRVELLIAEAKWHFVHSEYPEQTTFAQMAAQLAGETGMRDLEASAWQWCGIGLAWQGAHEEARKVLQRSLAQARAFGPPRLVGESLRHLAIIATNESDFPQAIVLLEQARAVHSADNDLEGESTVLVQLAEVMSNQGRLREARGLLEECLPIFVASGHKYRLVIVKGNLGEILIRQGELGRARKLLTEALQGCVELGDREGAAYAHAAIGEIHRRTGDLSQARQELREALDTGMDIGHGLLASEVFLLLAMIELDTGAAGESARMLDDSFAHAQRARAPLAQTRAQVGQSYALVAGGRLDEAQQLAAAALVQAQRLGLRGQIAELAVLQARIAGLLGDGREVARLLAGVTLDSAALEGAIRPDLLVSGYWEALDRAGDPRAAQALVAGLAYLDDFAARIGDPALRDGFLKHVPAHVRLAAAGRGGRG